MAHDFDYDLICIGGGSGGIATANRAAMNNASVLLIEKDDVLGGTCVNRGCVPKKVMWYGGMMAHTLEDAPGYGFDVTVNGFDWNALVSKREAYIDNINKSYDNYLGKNGVKTMQGYGKLAGPNTVDVDGKRISAERILIAPGGSPNVPDIPGKELAVTSDGFFEFEQQPKRVCVLGAGYIAVELAGLMAAMGSDVTLGVRKGSFLRDFDSMLQEKLMASMSGDGVTVETFFSASGLTKNGELIDVQGDNDKILKGFDAVIFAIGRSPATEGLGLETVKCLAFLHSAMSQVRQSSPRWLLPPVDAWQIASTAGSRADTWTTDSFLLSFSVIRRLPLWV